MITATEYEGVTYYSSIRRGIEYTANKTSSGDWWVSTRRLALGKMHIPGGKYYDSIEQVSSNVKAFIGLDALIN